MSFSVSMSIKSILVEKYKMWCGVGVIHLIQLIHFVARLSTTIWRVDLTNEISLSQESHGGQTGSIANVEPNLYYTSAVFCAQYCNLLHEDIKPNYTILSIAKRDLSDIELIFILDWDSFKMKHLERERIQISSRVNQLKHLNNVHSFRVFQFI